LRRLIDLKVIRDLETAAHLDPSLATLKANLSDPVVLATRQVFGADIVVVNNWQHGVEPGNDDWENLPELADEEYERRTALFDPCELSEREMVEVFRSHGWDLTDDFGRPLLTIKALAVPMMAAIHGVAGANLPGTDVDAASWGAGLEEQAARFRRGQR